MGNIVWLASYPKSGNTWFRVFLTNLCQPDKPAEINDLFPDTIASSRELFDEYTGVEASELSAKEILNYRPKVYDVLSSEQIIGDSPFFIKAHDAFIYNHQEKPIFSKASTRAVLYFVRNPLDVASSFAHHMNFELDKSIENMNDNEYSFCDSRHKLFNQLEQRLLTWSNHVSSWVNSELPVKVIRYEDMHEHSVETFSAAIEFCGLNYSEDEVRVALEKSNFSALQQQEREDGFAEKTMESKSFFRNGIAGGWQKELSSDQVELIIAQHGSVMKQLGYLEGKELNTA